MICEHLKREILEDLAVIPVNRLCDLKLKDYYELLGEEVESHELDCQCNLCFYFLQIGDEQ